MFKKVFLIVMFYFDEMFMYSTPDQKLQWGFQLFFFVASFVLTVIMIEMLVGFMCDSFDRVLGSEKTAKNYETAQMLY